MSRWTRWLMRGCRRSTGRFCDLLWFELRTDWLMAWKHVWEYLTLFSLCVKMAADCWLTSRRLELFSRWWGHIVKQMFVLVSQETLRAVGAKRQSSGGPGALQQAHERGSFLHRLLQDADALHAKHFSCSHAGQLKWNQWTVQHLRVPRVWRRLPYSCSILRNEQAALDDGVKNDKSNRWIHVCSAWIESVFLMHCSHLFSVLSCVLTQIKKAELRHK